MSGDSSIKSDREGWRVKVGVEETSAIYEPSQTDEHGVTFVCAHGAGGNMNDRGIVQTANTLRLKECITAVVARVREEIEPKKLIIGGRSMGGRAASMLAADGFECDGLLLLAYPLHPPGKPDQLRDAHLPAIRVPVICFNGTRDPFCTPDLMKAVLKNVKTDWKMHWVEGADHSFHVLKSSGRTDAEVLAEIGNATEVWVSRRIRG